MQAKQRSLATKVLAGEVPEKQLEDLGFKVKGTVTFKNGKYSVDGDVRLVKGYTKLPVQFETVTGDFGCRFNNLTILDGAPKTVGGDFLCSYNKLTKLDGAPETVGGDFYCGGNPNLKSSDVFGRVNGKVKGTLFPYLDESEGY